MLPLTRYFCKHPLAFGDLRRLASVAATFVKSSPSSSPMWVMVVMPGSLHIAAAAVRRMPENLFIILNGLDDWEVSWAQRHLREFGRLHRCRRVYPHYVLLDCLIEGVDSPFGIIDYDCFVRDSEVFQDCRQPLQDAVAHVFFSFLHPELRIRVPETFALFLDPLPLRDLSHRYRVSTAGVVWDQLPGRCRDKLGRMGINEARLPEPYKPGIDTLRVLFMLALAEGLQVSHLSTYTAVHDPEASLFHVGATSHPSLDEDVPYAVWGTYFWCRCAELCPDDELRRRYRQRFPVPAATVLARLRQLAGAVRWDVIEVMDQLAAWSGDTNLTHNS